MRLFGFFFSFFTRAKLFCIQVLHIAAAFYGREPIGGEKGPLLLHHMTHDRVNRFHDGSRTRICRDGSNKYYICLSTYINIRLYT